MFHTSPFKSVVDAVHPRGKWLVVMLLIFNRSGEHDRCHSDGVLALGIKSYLNFSSLLQTSFKAVLLYGERGLSNRLQ